MKKLTLTSALSGLIWLSLPSMAHIEQSEPFQSLRQSYFALLGMTFAPMGDMVKGESSGMMIALAAGRTTSTTSRRLVSNGALRRVASRALREPNRRFGPT